MAIDAAENILSRTRFGLGRRVLLGFAMSVAAGPTLAGRALAETGLGGATLTIRRLNEALLVAMRAGGATDFRSRFDSLGPVIDQTFDLQTVLAVSVGLHWPLLSADQKRRLLQVFRRYTVASYVAAFSTYAGQSFTVSPITRSLGPGREIVQSRIMVVNGPATRLDYVMTDAASGWKVVDVLVDGLISRVAVQRSDFRLLLTNGGGAALLANLERKTSDLSGGTLIGGEIDARWRSSG
jgi:phospholipid transport system substrate-binding protein